MERLKRNVTLKLSDGDLRGVIRLLSSPNEIACDSPQVLTNLRAKHPPAPAELRMPPGPENNSKPTEATDTDVVSAIFSFNTGSGAGLDGLRPAHLKDLIGKTSGEAGSKLVTQLRRLVNVALRGEIPCKARDSFYAGSLTALRSLMVV